MPDAAPAAGDIAADAVPRLPRWARLQYDGARERWVLQGPERILTVDETGKAILDLCDGVRDVAAIAAHLAAEYDAPADLIAHDVRALLAVLKDKRMVELS